MTLKEYLTDLSSDQKNDLAKRCNTSAGHLAHVANNRRTCGEDLAINIERETDRSILCEDLRPDVDWAYIRGTNSAA